MSSPALAPSREEVMGLDVVTHHFEILGEASRHIPGAIVEAHPAIPWRVMQDMRNRLIHGYFRVDATTLWLTAERSAGAFEAVAGAGAETAEE